MVHASAILDSHAEAERAVSELRAAGVSWVGFVAKLTLGNSRMESSGIVEPRGRSPRPIAAAAMTIIGGSEKRSNYQ